MFKRPLKIDKKRNLVKPNKDFISNKPKSSSYSFLHFKYDVIFGLSYTIKEIKL